LARVSGRQILNLLLSSWFRTLKSYYLEKLTDSQVDMFRMKGVAHTVQTAMEPGQFVQTEKEVDYFSSYMLRGTPGGEMGIVLNVRKNNCCINFKRKTQAVSLI
jgi:hypothetical protein